MDNLIVGVLIFGLLIITSGLIMIIFQIRKSMYSEKVIGTITELKEGSKYPRISYEYQGKKFTFRPNYYSSGMRVGKTFTVIFPPDQPDKPSLPAGGYTGSIVIIVLGLFFFLPAYFSHQTDEKFANKEKLIAPGAADKINVPILRIESGDVTINGTSTYHVIIAQQNDPEKETTRWFVSDKIWSNKLPRLPDYDRINVYISKDDPEEYYVDLSFLSEDYFDSGTYGSSVTQIEDPNGYGRYVLTLISIGLFWATRYVYRTQDRNSKQKEIKGFILLSSMTFIFSFCTIFYWISFADEQQEDELLKSSGKVVDAKLDSLSITSVDVSTDDAVVNYKIYCSWKNPKTGRKVRFQSKSFAGPSATHYERDKIKVYIDPTKPERYLVDLSLLTNQRRGIWLKYPI
jgi:Protein of unknown function (DUF3592)